jgi:hypothetical protein
MYPSEDLNKYVGGNLVSLTLISEIMDQHNITVQLLQHGNRAVYYVAGDVHEIAQRFEIPAQFAKSVPCNNPAHAIVNCLESFRTLVVQSGHDTVMVHKENRVERGDDGKFWASIMFFPYTRPTRQFHSPAE